MTSTVKSTSKSSSRRLSAYAIAVAAATFVLVPLAMNPGAAILYTAEAFDPVKFKLFMALSAILLVAVVGATLSGARPIRVPVLLPALAFLGVSLLSTLFSGKIIHSLVGEPYRYDGLLSLAGGVLLFYTLARFMDSWSKVRAVLTTGVAAAVVISVYGILQNFNLDPFASWDISWPTVSPETTNVLVGQTESDGRVFSTLGYPLWLSAYLTLMLGAALALYFRARERASLERWLWILAMALMGACWLYTYSRGAMLAFAVALPVVAFLAHRRLGSARPLILPLAVVAVSMSVAHFASPQTMDVSGRIAQTNLAPNLEKIPAGGDLSVTTRLLMWRDTIPMILERPLIGHGPDNFAEPFERHIGEDLRAFFPEGDTIDKAHNEFLQVAATTGLLGLAAYLWIFVSYFRNAYKSGDWYLLALSGGVLAYILQLQTAFTTIATGVTFWAILGVSVAIMRLQGREGEAESRRKEA